MWETTLLNKTVQYACDGCPKSAVVALRTSSMNRCTIRTSITLQPKPLLMAIKIPQHIPMSPNPCPLAGGTSKQPWPRIVFLFFFEFVEIYRYINYDGINPSYWIWGNRLFSDKLGRLPLFYRYNDQKTWCAGNSN